MPRWRVSTWVLLIYTVLSAVLIGGLVFTAAGQTGTNPSIWVDTIVFFLLYLGIGFLVLLWIQRRGRTRRP